MGRTLADADLEERSGAKLLAFRSGHGSPFIANPDNDKKLTAGSVLIGLGMFAQVEAWPRRLGHG